MDKRIKIAFFILFAMALALCLTLANIGSTFLSVVAIGFFLYSSASLAFAWWDMSNLTKYIKLFMPGRFDLAKMINQGREESLTELRYGCVSYLRNIYWPRVKRVLGVEELDPVEREFFESLDALLSELSNLEYKEATKALNLFHSFDLDQLEYTCDSEKAEECIELGLEVQEFICNYGVN